MTLETFIEEIPNIQGRVWIREITDEDIRTVFDGEVFDTFTASVRETLEKYMSQEVTYLYTTYDRYGSILVVEVRDDNI